MDNTQITYHYRDGDNYKAEPVTIVAAGKITYAEIKAYLEDEQFFIPSQVWLDDLLPDKPGAADHVWHAFDNEEGDFIPTDAPPTIDLTAADLLENFKQAAGNWNVMEAMFRAGMLW